MAQLDDRPADPAHVSDWSDLVMSEAELQATEFWVRVDELSYTPESLAEGSRPLSRVRRFKVANDELFQKVQGQIVEAWAAAGLATPRLRYRRRGAHEDLENWVTVVTYRNWAEIDEPVPNFEEAFRARHGDGAWATFEQEADEAVISRQDAYRQLVTGN